MTALSTAISLNHVSAITGYEVKGSLAGIKAGNLPQRIGILAETNTANQTGLPSKFEFTTAKEVGDLFGYGSPAHMIARILRPLSGDKLGGIPTVIYPVLEAGGATASVKTFGITGTATKNATHKLVVAGRDQIDGDSYSFAIAIGDGAAEISQKMADAVNNILPSPVIGSVNVNDAVFTTKWKGVTAAELEITVDVGGNAAGITYSLDSDVDGAGAPSISTALAAIGDEWDTLLINAIGSDSTTLDALENFNGNVNDKTGRYVATVFKPLVALVGSKLSTLAALSAITDGRKLEMTNVICPAPGSPAFSFEAAANVAFVYAPIAQNTPHSDPYTQYYPDMPVGTTIGDFSDTSKRDALVKVGCSTIKEIGGKYQIIDLITTYHPDNEPATATIFRYVRDIVGVDWNVKYKYALLEEIYVTGKTIVANDKVVSAGNTISPKRFNGILNTQLAPQLESDALSADANYMKENTEVDIGESNPNRFETIFKIKRTGIARVQPTTVETLFNFGG